MECCRAWWNVVDVVYFSSETAEPAVEPIVTDDKMKKDKVKKKKHKDR